MNLPIFGDEAIYLRWAQLVNGEGLGLHDWWVSLADPKPPLHFWLMALVFNWTRDPLLAARLISVVAGTLSVPLIIRIGEELGLLSVPSGPLSPNSFVSGPVLGLLSAVLLIFCPYVSFYQRLATADALFLCESLLIVWLALKWGRLACAGASAQWANWLTAGSLGVSWGLALLTRQGLSYTLFAMPVVAVVLNYFAGRSMRDAAPMRDRPRGLSILRERGLQFILACAIAFLMWSPYLLAELPPRAAINRRDQTLAPDAPVTTHDLVTEIKRRIFYQDQFTAGGPSRLQVTLHNAHDAFVPTWLVRKSDAAWIPETGWLFFYLTPAIYLAGMLGILCLLWRRQWLLLLFLGMWMLLLLGPPIVLGNTIFSRYVLAGAIPLLITAAFFVAEVTSIVFTYFSTKRVGLAPAWCILALGTAALMLQPLHQIALQSTRWWDQNLTRRDRYQYLTGWPSGAATIHALSKIEELAKVGPLIVITTNAWGLPADAAWVYLSRLPNVQLYYTDSDEIFRPAGDAATENTFLFRKNKWTFEPAQSVKLSMNIPILYLTSDPIHRDPAGDLPVEEFLKAKNPNLELISTFYGIEEPGEDRVKLFRYVKKSESAP